MLEHFPNYNKNSTISYINKPNLSLTGHHYFVGGSSDPSYGLMHSDWVGKKMMCICKSMK